MALKPMVRDGICGAPIVRTKLGPRSTNAGYREGGVVGFCCFTDIPGLDEQKLLFGEVTTPLTLNGWKMKGGGGDRPDKRKAGDSVEGGE